MSFQPRQAIESWLNDAPRPPCVLAWGVRLPDRNTVTRSFWDGFPDLSLEHAWRAVGEVLDALKQQRLPTEKQRWIFQNHRLLCAARPDGAFLGMFTRSLLNDADEAQIEHLFQEFVGLKLS